MGECAEVWADVEVVGFQSHIALTIIFISFQHVTKYTRLPQRTASDDWVEPGNEALVQMYILGCPRIGIGHV